MGSDADRRMRVTKQDVIEGLKWSLGEVADTLGKIGCCHGHDTANTPPMMYPEWIGCVMAKVARDAELRGRRAGRRPYRGGDSCPP